MSYCGYVTNLMNVREHTNADKLMLATCFEYHTLDILNKTLNFVKFIVNIL